MSFGKVKSGKSLEIFLQNCVGTLLKIETPRIVNVMHYTRYTYFGVLLRKLKSNVVTDKRGSFSYQIFYFPSHVGFPLGTEDAPKYVVMETHYDNPGIRSGKMKRNETLLSPVELKTVWMA